jgi:hypothetical protein
MSYEKTLNLIFSNDLILEELKRLFQEEADKHTPRVVNQTDEVLGQEYRAHQKAKEIIEDAFITIKNLQNISSTSSGINYK